MKNFPELTEKELAYCALNKGLFVQGWQMEQLYKDIVRGNRDLGIHVLMDKDILIGACILNGEDGSLNTFVTESHRGKKMGQRLVAQTLSKYGKNVLEVYGSGGIEGSEKFYNSCGIAYFHDGYFSLCADEVQLLTNQEITIQDIRQRRIKEYLDNNGLSFKQKKSLPK